MTNKPHKKYIEPEDPFTPKRNYTYNPERLSDNGTLDTFLHRVRTEMLNTNKYKQDKRDNLTRKERFALRELINNPHIVINKADKGSTIFVEDGNEYISSAMIHLNDPKVYKPLHRHLSHTKRTNHRKTQSIKKQWFPKTSMV